MTQTNSFCLTFFSLHWHVQCRFRHNSKFIHEQLWILAISKQGSGDSWWARHHKEDNARLLVQRCRKLDIEENIAFVCISQLIFFKWGLLCAIDQLAFWRRCWWSMNTTSVSKPPCKIRDLSSEMSCSLISYCDSAQSRTFFLWEAMTCHK